MILHKILQGAGAEVYLPFARSRLRALEKLYGAEGFFQQKYNVPGAYVEVQQAPPFQYLRITATGEMMVCIDGTTFREPWSLQDFDLVTPEFNGDVTPDPAWVRSDNITRVYASSVYEAGQRPGLWLALPSPETQDNGRYIQVMLTDVQPLGTDPHFVVLALYTGNPNYDNALDTTFAICTFEPGVLSIDTVKYSNGGGVYFGSWSEAYALSTAKVRYEILGDQHTVTLNDTAIISATATPYASLGSYLCLFPDTTYVNGDVYSLGVRCIQTGDVA